MPGRIVFANGVEIRVSEDANRIHSRLNESHGSRVRVSFEVPAGDRTKVVFVNPDQIAYLEDVLESGYEGRGVASVDS